MSFVDSAFLIPLLPALGWLSITLFSKLMPGRAAAWWATGLMAASAFLAIGLFLEVKNAAPIWDAKKLEKVFELKHHKAAGPEHATETATATATDANGKEIVASSQTNSGEALIEETLQSAKIFSPSAESFPIVREWPWLALKNEQGLPFGFYFDQLAAIMILMVTVVCTFIHLFSIGYMWGEERYPTFFSYINLFAASMLAMLMAKNLFHVLLFWEVMGLMSYLLIGFFFKKKTAQQAQRKAFLTVRVGDLAFMAGLFWLYQKLGTLDIPTILGRGEAGTLGLALGGAATGIGLLLFIAAVGKSAQFPLHVWLPDAMEGPTPVSAMIHAATMVAAGVYLVGRAYPIMEVGGVLPVIAAIGGFTAIFAASMAPAMADAKKIMAYSTLSQLGYMFLSLGVFGYTAAMFHLLTHAFFKALLFLGSGSMIHGAGTQDIFEMNALGRYQKWTYWTVLIGAMSLMGVPLTAGFWSKDEILHGVQTHPVLYLMAFTAAILTAFYTTRMMVIAFAKPASASPFAAAPWNQQGEPSLNMSQSEVEQQNKDEAAHGHGHHAHGEPHESGPEMIVPLVALAAMSLVMGFSGSPFFANWFQRFVYYKEPDVIPFAAALPGYVISLIILACGVVPALNLYKNGNHLEQRAPLWLTRLLQRRYFIDDFYYNVVVRVVDGYKDWANWFDTNIVDKLVDFVGWFTATLGDVLRRAQTGLVGAYAWMIVIGAAIMALAFAFAGGAK